MTKARAFNPKDALLAPNSGVIFMKVGNHAQETLDDIVRRKRKELDDAGVIYWGYGGSTCHPLTVVKPYADRLERAGHVIHLLMEPMDSKHFAEPALAEEYSDDGVKWKPIPRGVHVRGSRYALVLDSFDEQTLDLDLSQLRVAIGACQGRPASEYVKGRVDKGCFVVDPSLRPADLPPKHIGLIASVRSPYAVLLR